MTAASGSFARPPLQGPPLQRGLLRTDMGRAGLIGAVGSLVLLGLIGLWSQTALIDAAVIAPGQVVVRGQPRPVQNLDGGIVEAVLVANGDVVTEGQVLLRLDPTLLRVNLDIYRNRLAEALARKTRLEAEQLGLSPADLAAPDMARLRASGTLDHLAGLALDRHHEGQRQIMAARAEVQRGRADQLAEKIKQFGNQRAGTEGLIAATRDQLASMDGDLANLRALAARGLVRKPDLQEMERNRADLWGRLASLQAELATLANSVRDTELEILQSGRAFREEVVTELREVSAEADELILQIVTTQKQLDRIEMRAPVAGVVHEMQMTGPGGVLAAGATALEIVPLGEGLEFELRLDPRAIDQVHAGQTARVQFPAFQANATPQVTGTVTEISPTSVTDPATRTQYYRLQLVIAPEELARLGDRALVPGMPVEAFLDAGSRTAWSYLTQPLADQIDRAFREE
jgi:HlyD family secretion protein